MQDNHPDRSDSPEADFEQRIIQDTKRIIRFNDRIGPNDSKSALKHLFLKLLDDLSINERKWRRNMEVYLRDPVNGIPNNTEEHVQQRSAMNKNFITNEQMTWKVFLRALRFIRVKRFRFSVTLVHNNDTTTEHGMWINIRDSYPHLEEDDDPRSTYDRIPVVEVRDDGARAGASVANVDPPSSAASRIHVPPAIDFSAYRKHYPPVGGNPEQSGD